MIKTKFIFQFQKAEVSAVPETAGALYDVVLDRNRIFHTGLDGIGVVGFFDLRDKERLISVNRLTITGNEIRGCLQRPLLAISAAHADSMGYGGIALADVNQLSIRDNTIEANGTGIAAPVCGIFVLHAEGMEISRNRIVENGRSIATKGDAVLAGRCGGINVVHAVAPTLAGKSGAKELYSFQGPTGLPAVKVHENVVGAPVGQALSIAALGSTSVVGNYFTTSGVSPTQMVDFFSPATVLIWNVGRSNEGHSQLPLFQTAIGGPLTNPALYHPPPGGRPPRGSPGNGNILFANNQCTLDLLELRGARFSITIRSLDDIGFHGNQCECNLPNKESLFSQTLVFGTSLRVSDNRFKEGMSNASFSAITIGSFNMTVHNQATHCLSIQPKSSSTQDQPNTVLIETWNHKVCNPNLSTTVQNLLTLMKGYQ